ncbi:SNF2 family N-terminal domain-containing protein [Cyathus striatus]|nr:SNF2 family N-terminal domain-containing protein [Cyathus striatus]
MLDVALTYQSFSLFFHPTLGLYLYYYDSSLAYYTLAFLRIYFMLSSSESIARDNKRAALEQLKFNKSRNTDRSTHPSSSSATSTSLSQPSYVLPPAQSRDATFSSRFFPSTPSSTYGNVLVPNSSPLAPDDSSLIYGSPGEFHQHDVATTNVSKSWNSGRSLFPSDPLSAPSGFVSSTTSTHASFRHQWSTDMRHVDPMHDDGPPRKRMNLGTSLDTYSTPESASSPQILRPGQRRRRPTDALSFSSDDSLPDASQILHGTRPRITRNRPSPSPDTSSTMEPSDETKFTRFRLTMPTEPPPRVRAAWIQAGGDIKKATALLSDSSWSPSASAKEAKERKLDEHMGRVKEVDEATKAQRAAVKEKGKKSMIYANRGVLETKPIATSSSTPPSSKLAMNLAGSPPAPMSPVPVQPRKRAKKLVVDSESEGELAASDEEDHQMKKGRTVSTYEARALDYFNITGSEALQELTGCSPEQAETIIKLRPFGTIEDLNKKLGQGKKKAGPAGISPRMFEDSKNIFKGYGAVDKILEECENIGLTLRSAISSWTTVTTSVTGKKMTGVTSLSEAVEDGALSLSSVSSLKQKSKDFLETQPLLISDTMQLKEYQLLGVNWLNLLYLNDLSCILADEMGLGKTIQVISFLAHLKEGGSKGPHLVVVPSSTLENWCREFARFAPSISVQTYYAGKDERSQLRQTLSDTQRSNNSSPDGWEVLITTYNLAQGDGHDRKFFRKIDWDCCIFDEGHVLKNFNSQRYQSLLKFPSKWRLLLTGTPLQNNLQELVSLMNFILPDQFAESLESLRAIFKVKGDSKVSLLSQERVSRAKKMMTPFVLRRRKDQVLKDLPNKTERIEWCEMTDLQRSIYTDALQRSRKTIFNTFDATTSEPDVSANAKGRQGKKNKAGARVKDKIYLENSSNVLMDLRKAASHPMLFRTRFTDDILSKIAKQLLKEPDFKKRGALFDLVKEDMTVMTDAELQAFCGTYKSIQKYQQDKECYLEAGKVQVLLKLLVEYSKQRRKVLIFSQFTQILDILQAVLKYKKVKYLMLTGSTPVDVRQTLVDEFTEDDTISVFLLSTKAGGMGINLTAASVVVMFDQDFNPHNDKQAQDRAYRIGQKHDVDVVKLISKGTIEEDMLRLGETKLALDEAVAGDVDDKGESAPEREMKTSLMNVLRQQFEKQQDQER